MIWHMVAGCIFAVLLAAAACSGGGSALSTPNASVSRPTSATVATSAATPAPTPAASDSSATPPPPPKGGATPHPGDPAVVGDALQRLQAYLDVWRANGSLASGAMLVPAERPKVDMPAGALSAAVAGYYRVYCFTSADDFILLVALDLHFPNGDGGAYGEGINGRFVTFSRANPSDPFLMSLATSPPVFDPPITGPPTTCPKDQGSTIVSP